jgi:hypothetical protein
MTLTHSVKIKRILRSIDTYFSLLNELMIECNVVVMRGTVTML